MLRKLAKELARGDWRGFLDSFRQDDANRCLDGVTERHGEEAAGQDTATESRVGVTGKHDRVTKSKVGVAESQGGAAESDGLKQFDDKKPIQNDTEIFEEIMLQGMVIGYAKIDVEERLRLIAGFVPKISNWSVCDSFCFSLDFTKKHKERVWEFLLPYFSSNSEYDLRFAIVMLLNYYIDDEYIDKVLLLLDGIKHEGYYAKMAVAWAISVCYIKYPDKTMKYLKNNNLDDFTYNKAIQKIIESNRINKNTKDLLRKMKRNQVNC